MPAPLQQLHVEPGCIGNLDQKQFLRPDVADTARRDAARKGVEGIEDQADCRMIGVAHQCPCLAMVVDVQSPRQCFIADLEPACGGAVAQLMQVGDHARPIGQGKRRAVRAQQHKRRAQFGHYIELALHTLESPGALRFRHGFQIAEGLEQRDSEAKVGGDGGDIARAAWKGDEIGFENLDTLKAGSGDGGQLLLQRAAERHGGD